jgi:hypothetical protein
LIGDKAYDADPLIDTLNERGIDPVIRQRPTARARGLRLPTLLRTQLIERFFNKLKHFSTRYDKPPEISSPEFEARLRYHPPQLKTGPSL